MTLNVTVTTSKHIYQCADYRGSSMATSAPISGGYQKAFLVNTFEWNAILCYCGVASYGNLVNVEEWVSATLAQIGQMDPFDRLLEKLLLADSWLNRVPPPHNRHSFSVGAFIGSKPVFTLVSNFETVSGIVKGTADSALSVTQTQPTKPKAYVSGQRQLVTRADRRRLEALARNNVTHQEMYEALAKLNRQVAQTCGSVSEACFTSHLSLTGEGGGVAHDTKHRPRVQPIGLPSGAEDTIQRLVDDHFGPGGGYVKGVSVARSASSEEEHKTRIREKPDDPSLHSNYGAFLQDKKKDPDAAESAYRRALELEPNHTNALGNLANLLADRGENDEAEELYRKALEGSPGNENVSWNYARFLRRVRRDEKSALSVIDVGISANETSGRLKMLRGELELVGREFDRAVQDFEAARELGADQIMVETGVAYALHMSGAPIDDCIDAYRTAIALAPDQGALKLNLAQLLFLREADGEARTLLDEALRSEIDESAQLEAYFYMLAHESMDKRAIENIHRLLAGGARLNWDVQQNIERVRKNEPEKAALLERVNKVMAGEMDLAAWGGIVRQWQKRL